MAEQEYRVRECVHRTGEVAGEFYRGTTYLKYLQRLRSAAALQVAAKITPFFWSDAANVVVWLCRECAEELGLHDHERRAAG